jgi:hypothetical protein
MGPAQRTGDSVYAIPNISELHPVLENLGLTLILDMMP